MAPGCLGEAGHTSTTTTVVVSVFAGNVVFGDHQKWRQKWRVFVGLVGDRGISPEPETTQVVFHMLCFSEVVFTGKEERKSFISSEAASYDYRL